MHIHMYCQDRPSVHLCYASTKISLTTVAGKVEKLLAWIPRAPPPHFQMRSKTPDSTNSNVA